MKPVVWMFSGLGSQRYNMGASLLRNDPVFRQTMEHCDEIVKPLLHGSLLETIYLSKDKSFEEFVDIRFVTPALFSVQYSLAQSLMAKGRRPDYLVGYSLGEYVAYVLAGILDLQDCLHCIINFAQIAQECCQPASMIAILNMPRILNEMAEPFQEFHLAAINFDTNFVVTGPHEAAGMLLAYLSKKDIVAQILPVEYGFHSHLIEPMKEPYLQQLRKIPLHQPQLNVVSACQASLLQQIELEDFWRVLRHPIDFRHTITFLKGLGDCELVDFGPSGTMANFIKYDGRITTPITCALI